MRAVLVKDGKGPVENLYLGEAPTPTPKEDEVLVKIRAFGLNRMDISQRNGGYNLPPGASTILGVEFSGHVSALGAGVTGWKEGDEVFGLASGGAYAEFIAVPQRNLMRKPAHLSWTEAASVPENFLTAFQALALIAEIKKGDHVLIHAGASGVGVAAIQLSRLLGAATVTATASSTEKLDWLLSLPNGATHAVNYRTQDFAAETKKATGGKGADVVVDLVGQSHWHKNIEALALDGRMAIIGLLSGSEVATLNMSILLYKRLRIQGSTLRSRSADYQAALIAKFGHDVLDSITNATGGGAVRTYIHEVFPWTKIQEAHHEMEANKNSGKIIVEVV
ncbi:uncharacterized protein FIBRA_07970 [Fibroporia radiculosa]|uniref:Enoyl reductase (ER) domain-containing protein n=1 Tax=Fibroporia radiculosa TaxID=599839 RepID=J4GG28_9APHY|nr:uncharacterized protein FIBRA_07970 [Fibroporia radiculosa]CCM05738.1 predicted protein [Fibroporia radiculosa]